MKSWASNATELLRYLGCHITISRDFDIFISNELLIFWQDLFTKISDTSGMIIKIGRLKIHPSKHLSADRKRSWKNWFTVRQINGQTGIITDRREDKCNGQLKNWMWNEKERKIDRKNNSWKEKRITDTTWITETKSKKFIKLMHLN